MTTGIENPFSFEDLSKILNINKENYSDTINELVHKFIEVRNQEKRDVYRFRFSEIDSIVITVSDVLDNILDTKKADLFILDISIKYCIDVTNKGVNVKQVSPFNFDSLKKAKNIDDVIALTDSLGKLESQDILNIKDYPFTLKGFAISGEIPRVSIAGAVSYLPSTGLREYYKNEFNANSDLVSNLPDYVFSINLNVSISNIRSSFMR